MLPVLIYHFIQLISQTFYPWILYRLSCQFCFVHLVFLMLFSQLLKVALLGLRIHLQELFLIVNCLSEVDDSCGKNIPGFSHPLFLGSQNYSLRIFLLLLLKILQLLLPFVQPCPHDNQLLRFRLTSNHNTFELPRNRLSILMVQMIHVLVFDISLFQGTVSLLGIIAGRWHQSLRVVNIGPSFVLLNHILFHFVNLFPQLWLKSPLFLPRKVRLIEISKSSLIAPVKSIQKHFHWFGPRISPQWFHLLLKQHFGTDHRIFRNILLNTFESK